MSFVRGHAAKRPQQLLRSGVWRQRSRSPQQSYLCFVVAQNGTWLIKRRDGDATSTVSPKTPNDAVKKPDASGKSTNALEVRVTADKIAYVVNGKVVRSTPKAGLTMKTDGLYGIRVNHMLDVQVDGFALSKP